MHADALQPRFERFIWILFTALFLLLVRGRLDQMRPLHLRFEYLRARRGDLRRGAQGWDEFDEEIVVRCAVNLCDKRVCECI